MPKPALMAIAQGLLSHWIEGLIFEWVKGRAIMGQKGEKNWARGLEVVDVVLQETIDGVVLMATL